MAGGFQLTDEQEDLSKVFVPGKEVAIYHTPAEAIEKIRYYLEHPAGRVAIAHAGRIRAERDHTLAVRLRQLLDQLHV